LNISVEQLPVILETHEPFDKLAENYARRWPQLAGASWFPAVADGAANNIGADCTSVESCALMIGTSGAMRVMWEGQPPLSLLSSLWCYRADRKRVLVGGALSDGGGLYSWMMGALALPDKTKETEDELAATEPDAHGLTLLPFWSGERSTGWHAGARGAIYGLTISTRPIEILRAAMEAIAYRFALIASALDGVAPNAKVVASGGALHRSPVWSQIMADVLNRPVQLAKIAEASSRGACLLALEATGKLKSIEHAPFEFGQTFEPDAARHALYSGGLERQQKLYERLVAEK
jgi:gluconokinase